MRLNPYGLGTIAALTTAIFFITGCGGSNALTKSPGTTTTAFVTAGAANTSGAAGSSSSGGSSLSSSSSGSNTTSAPTPVSTPSNNGNAQLPPAGATVIATIQNQSGWQTCQGCGNNGGTGPGPAYGFTQGVSAPSLSGTSTNFWITGGPAYSGGYYFIEQPPVQNPASYLRYEFDIYVPSQYATAPQALEFECQQNANGYTYNYAWQADYVTREWRVFNYTTKQWEPTRIAFQPFAADTWHHIIAIYHASGTQIVHDSLTIDGTTYPANIAHNALFTGNSPELTNGFQVDLDGNSTPYHVYVDNMNMTLAD